MNISVVFDIFYFCKVNNAEQAYKMLYAVYGAKAQKKIDVAICLQIFVYICLLLKNEQCLNPSVHTEYNEIKPIIDMDHYTTICEMFLEVDFLLG